MRVTLVAASRQNVFFEEIEQCVTHALRTTGAIVDRVVDHFPAPEAGRVFVTIPHEFVALTDHHAHPDAAQLARTIAIATEQPGTSWWDISRAFCAETAATVDINRVGVRALRAKGIEARYLPLGYCPKWDAWRRDEQRARPHDVLFLGGHTDRRARAIALCGDVLARHDARIHIVDNAVPLRADTPGVLTGAAKWELYADSKVLLNVHRSSQGYFEWHRGLSAMINGCVVMSDHSLDFAPLIPGEDLLSVGVESMPAVLDRLLADDDWRRQLQTSAIKRVRRELPVARTAAVLVDAALRALEARAPRTRRFVTGSRSPRPEPNPTRVPAYAFLATEASDEQKVRIAVKQILRQQRQIERTLARLVSADQSDSTPQVGEFGPERNAAPEVSVVLTLHNYADVVGEAIASVTRSTHRSLELVIVDDASTDDSLAAARTALNRAPWLTGRIVECARNVGLPTARNLGVEHAQGEFVFILDADNAVYEQGIERLVRALNDDPEATFAYGLIERFDIDGPCDLMSWRGWDPVELRYNNFIDAMALIRREVLLEIGGYTTDARLYGWEDFDLWCGLAGRGHHGVQVPTVVARYRTGRFSMISLTNIDTSDCWSALLERHPGLATPREVPA